MIVAFSGIHFLIFALLLVLFGCWCGYFVMDTKYKNEIRIATLVISVVLFVVSSFAIGGGW